MQDATEVVDDHGESQFVLSAEEGCVERHPQAEVTSVIGATTTKCDRSAC